MCEICFKINNFIFLIENSVWVIFLSKLLQFNSTASRRNGLGAYVHSVLAAVLQSLNCILLVVLLWETL